jgi:hypothetical protein
MNSNLSHLISDYQASVRTAVQLIQKSGIQLPATNRDWVATDIPKRGQLLGGVPYFKHGYGCAVKLPTGTIDFDFGKRGEIDGFDEWRLIRFAGLKLFEYGFPSEDSLKECFKAEVTAGSLVYSGHILYYITDAT